jgi:hypothetical protein
MKVNESLPLVDKVFQTPARPNNKHQTGCFGLVEFISLDFLILGYPKRDDVSCTGNAERILESSTSSRWVVDEGWLHKFTPSSSVISGRGQLGMASLPVPMKSGLPCRR